MGRRHALGFCLGLGLLVSALWPSFAQTGVPTLDLRQSPLDLKRGFALNPDWEFYWQQLLSPEELQAGKGLLSGVLNQEVFQKYEGVLHQGVNQKRGYLTIRSRIKLPEMPQPIVLSLGKLSSSFRIWIDGKLVGEIGTVGTNSDNAKAVFQPFLFELQARPDGNEIVMQLSNFKNYGLGPLRPLVIFEKQAFFTKRQQKMLLDFFLVGAAFVMSFYHFALYWIRRSEPAAFYFGLFCFVNALRAMVMSEGFVTTYEANFEPFPYGASTLIEMLGFTLAVICFYQFVTALYPKEVPKFLRIAVVSLSYLYTAVILTTDGHFYIRFLQPYQLLILIAGPVMVYSLLLAIKRRREGARIFVLGFVLLFGAVVNDILLHNGIVSTFDMATIGLFAFLLAQSIILAKRFARAFEQVSIAEKEIRTLNDDLELKVIERTHTIRTILDNVRSGFLMIDSEYRIMDGFTKSCWEILGPQVASKVQLVDLLDLSSREKMLLELALRQAFDDMMPEDVTLAQIPSRFHLGRKVVGVQGSVVRNSLGKPEALLLSISDASQLVKAEQESTKNKSLLKIISEKTSFRSFIKDSLDSLNGCMPLLEQQNQKEISMVLHTLKGNFALYGLEPIAAFIHEIEEKRVLSKVDIKAIVQTVEEFITLNGGILGLETHGLEKDTYEVAGDSLQKLESDLQKAGPSRGVLLALNSWVREVRMVPVRELLGPIEANVERVADALGKHVDFAIEGAELRVDPHRMRLPLKNLIHAVINSIDHGIEYPEERGDKDPSGQVKISFCYDELAYLKVIVQDDGRGLDLDLIRQHALNKGLVTAQEIEKMAEPEIQALIFRQGFSTKSDVSEFSGRGVGIAALDYAVRSLGGQIRVYSKSHEGTVIDISIPTEQTLELLTGIA